MGVQAIAAHGLCSSRDRRRGWGRGRYFQRGRFGTGLVQQPVQIVASHDL